MTTIEDGIREKIVDHFEDKDVHLITEFLDRGFLQNGQIVIASIFLYAAEQGKSAEEILEACESEWKRSWQFQHPELKGDADAFGAAGMQNRASLENIYGALGIPSPLEAGKADIPTTSFVVVTINSTYRLGEADEDGGRSISKDGGHLDFTRCRVIDLKVGARMNVECLDGPYPPGWSTSPVKSIG